MLLEKNKLLRGALRKLSSAKTMLRITSNSSLLILCDIWHQNYIYINSINTCEKRKYKLMLYIYLDDDREYYTHYPAYLIHNPPLLRIFNNTLFYIYIIRSLSCELLHIPTHKVILAWALISMIQDSSFFLFIYILFASNIKLCTFLFTLYVFFVSI